MERWVGRVAVVTGASAGIGAAVCKDLVEQGMVVVGLARREDRLKELKDELKGKKGTFHYVKVDLTKDNDVKKTFKWIKEEIGGVDVLVNNAAVNERGPAHEVSMEDWRRVYDVNLFAVLSCSQEAIKSMKERDFGGHVIVINSVGAHRRPFTNGSIYGSAKHASKIVTQGMIRDLIAQKSNIKVTDLSPGLVETELFSANNIQLDFSNFPHLQPEEIAKGIRDVIATPPNVHINEVIIRAIGDDS